MLCTVEILSIGNELLLGNTVNTNASWIAFQVTKLGANVTRITTVADNLGEISSSIREALARRPKLIITTGGIGPTFDDMTFRGVARALRTRVALNPDAVDMIRKHYARRFPGRKLTLTKPRLKMAMIPSTATPIRNPIGTAPGITVTTRTTEVFCLPGVPREAKAIFRDSVAKVVSAKARGGVFAERWLEVHGIMESTLAPIIDRVMRRWPGVYVKSHPRGMKADGRPFIEIHLSISSTNPREARRLVLGAAKALRKELRPDRN